LVCSDAVLVTGEKAPDEIQLFLVELFYEGEDFLFAVLRFLTDLILFPISLGVPELKFLKSEACKLRKAKQHMHGWSLVGMDPTGKSAAFDSQ